MCQARATPGGLDFVCAADPLYANRVNDFERRATRGLLQAFRGSGPEGELIEAANVRQYKAEG